MCGQSPEGGELLFALLQIVYTSFPKEGAGLASTPFNEREEESKTEFFIGLRILLLALKAKGKSLANMRCLSNCFD